MSSGAIMKSAALGITVGAITYAVSNSSSRNRRKMKRTANRAMKAFGTVIDGVSFLTR